MEKINDSPAPCAYAAEKVNLNQTPAFSFGSRVNHEKPSDTPGIHPLLFPWK